MTYITNHLDTLSQEEFEFKLAEFFQRHDPSGVRAVKEISKKYSDKKAEVFARLTELYRPEVAQSGAFYSIGGGPSMGANAGSTPMN